MQRHLGIKKTHRTPDFLMPDFFLEHSWSIFIVQGKMKNGTINPKLLLTSVCMRWFSKNGFLNYFSVADCKVKIFFSIEMVNEDMIGIPLLFPTCFSLWNKLQWKWQDFLKSVFISMQSQSPILPENGLMNVFHPVLIFNFISQSQNTSQGCPSLI